MHNLISQEQVFSPDRQRGDFRLIPVLLNKRIMLVLVLTINTNNSSHFSKRLLQARPLDHLSRQFHNPKGKNFNLMSG